jgi:hypothetical protein
MATQKFRPYFTLDELTEISSALKIASKNRNLIKYVDTQIVKASSGLSQPQYTTNPAPTISQKLGLEQVLDSMTDKKLRAYQKFQVTPAICTVNELDLAKMYRYENNLMDTEEEAEYEKSMGAY